MRTHDRSAGRSKACRGSSPPARGDQARWQHFAVSIPRRQTRRSVGASSRTSGHGPTDLFRGFADGAPRPPGRTGGRGRPPLRSAHLVVDPGRVVGAGVGPGSVRALEGRGVLVVVPHVPGPALVQGGAGVPALPVRTVTVLPLSRVNEPNVYLWLAASVRVQPRRFTAAPDVLRIWTYSPLMLVFLPRSPPGESSYTLYRWREPAACAGAGRAWAGHPRGRGGHHISGRLRVHPAPADHGRVGVLASRIPPRPQCARRAADGHGCGFGDLSERGASSAGPPRSLTAVGPLPNIPASEDAGMFGGYRHHRVGRGCGRLLLRLCPAGEHAVARRGPTPRRRGGVPGRVVGRGRSLRR